MRCKVEEFVDLETNTMIRRLTDITDETKVQYLGFAEAIIDTPQGQGKIPVQSQLGTDSVEKAFEMMPQVIEDHKKQIQDQITEQSRIVGPDGRPASAGANDDEPLIFPGR